MPIPSVGASSVRNRLLHYQAYGRDVQPGTAALVVGRTVGLGVGLRLGLAVGLFGALNAGGRACLEHLALRLLLVRNGSAPWDYAKFLDCAAERILLRKVGGGYIFIHRMLLEYFAARYDESTVEATPNAEPSQIAIEA